MQWRWLSRPSPAFRLPCPFREGRCPSLADDARGVATSLADDALSGLRAAMVYSLCAFGIRKPDSTRLRNPAF